MTGLTRGDPQRLSERHRHTLARSAVVLLVLGIVGIAATVLSDTIVDPSWGSPVIAAGLLAADSCALWSLIPAWLLLEAGPEGSYRRTAIVVTRLAAATLALDVGLYVWAAFFQYD